MGETGETDGTGDATGEAAAPRRALLWLALGCAAGVALSAWGLLADAPSQALPKSAVARVNGALIRTDAYHRLVAALAADLRGPVTPELRRRVLDRMIEEELLVQRGLELGLAASDRRVRADLSSAVIRAVVVEAEDESPSKGALRRFYQEQADFFTRPGRFRVAQIYFRAPGAPGGAGEEAARRRAERARARIAAGEDFESLRGGGDADVSPLPDALLPPAKLRDYLGPTALQAVMALAPGEISAPLRGAGGFRIFRLLQREPPRLPPFEEIIKQVQAEWRRRAGDEALRRYLDELRERAEVAVRPQLP